MVNQQPAIAGSTGSLQERVSMRLINKRKRSSSPQRRPHVVDGKLAISPDVQVST